MERKNIKTKINKILASLSFLTLMINSGLVIVLLVMFYTALEQGGILTIDIVSYGEMYIEAYLVMPFIAVSTIITTLYMMRKIIKEI